MPFGAVKKPPHRGKSIYKERKPEMFKSNKIELRIGLKKPVKLLQLTDVHLSLSDERNKEEMIPYAAGRRNTFFQEGERPERDPIGYLQEAMEYAKNFDCTVITGDLVDFNTYKNYDVAKEILAGKDYLFCAGNHEFTPKPGIDSYELKANTAEYIQSHFRGNMFFESRIVGGVNIVALDNGYGTYTKDQLEKLKAEIQKGFPILIFCHVPLHKGMLAAENYNREGHLRLGATEENVDEIFAVSAEITTLMAKEPLIKAFFTGHGHSNALFDFEGKPCYMIGGLFKGIVGEITLF